MISLCVITKNEARFIENCLRSAGEYADDMVVADTGSSDDTKEIALRCGARVYDFAWVDDFSAARNFAAERARYDWVLVLDADEELVSFDKAYVQDFMRGAAGLGRITLHHIGADEVGGMVFRNRLPRLYNRCVFHFTGAIHEQLTHRERPGYSPAADIPVLANHYGYDPGVVAATGKLARNKVLLARELASRPTDPYYLYQMGKNEFAMRCYEEALPFFERAIAQDPDPAADYVYTLIECYGYALLKTARYAESLALLSYAPRYERNPNFTFLLAHIYLNNGMFSDALGCFERVISQGDGARSLGLTRLAYFNIGVILETAGMEENAKAYYAQCGDYEPALKRLAGG